MKQIVVSDVCKSYDGRPVLRNVSFTAGTDRPTCLRAPSGTGKTALLRLLLGLERLLEHLDAMANLRFAAGPALEKERARRLLEELGLEEAGGKLVRAYSGGMKRRLALARALLVPCDALALDEPFAGLDADNRRRAWACVEREAAGKIVLLSSHEDLEPDAAVVRL